MTTKRHKGPSVSTTGNPHWCSPGWVLDVVREFNNGRITLDPCGNTDDIVRARRSWWGPGIGGALVAHDGLGRDWQVRRGPPGVFGVGRSELGVAYMNPPYARTVVDRWVAKAHHEGRLGGVDVVGLLPARMSSAWFRAHCFPPHCDAVCFLGRRVKFIGAESAPSWETVLVHWGPHSARFAEIMAAVGTVWRA